MIILILAFQEITLAHNEKQSSVSQLEVLFDNTCWKSYLTTLLSFIYFIRSLYKTIFSQECKQNTSISFSYNNLSFVDSSHSKFNFSSSHIDLPSTSTGKQHSFPKTIQYDDFSMGILQVIRQAHKVSSSVQDQLVLLSLIDFAKMLLISLLETLTWPLVQDYTQWPPCS